MQSWIAAVLHENGTQREFGSNDTGVCLSFVIAATIYPLLGLLNSTLNLGERLNLSWFLCQDSTMRKQRRQGPLASLNMLVLKQLENDATVIYPLYVAILFNSTHWHLVFQIMPKILCCVYKNVVSAQNQISRTESI